MGIVAWKDNSAITHFIVRRHNCGYRCRNSFSDSKYFGRPLAHGSVDKGELEAGPYNNTLRAPIDIVRSQRLLRTVGKNRSDHSGYILPHSNFYSAL